VKVADLWERFRTSSSSWLRSWPARYGLAVLAVAAAAILQLGLRWLGFLHLPYLMFLPAVLVTALLAGFWPGIAATLLATVTGGYFIFSFPGGHEGESELLRPMLFLILGAFLTLLAHSRREAAEALGEREAELNRAQVVAHIGSWHYDIARGTLRLSDEAYRILGLPVKAELSLQQGRDMVHPDDLVRLDSAWDTALASGTFNERSRITVGGETRWVRIQASIEHDAQGAPPRAVGTVQDITERRVAKERLEEFEKVVESLEEMIVVFDRDYRYVIANQAFLKHRGLRKEQVIGHRVPELLDPEVFRNIIKAKLDECFRGKVVQYGLRYNYPTLGERDIFASYFPIERPEGVDRVACVLRDITEKKRVREQLRASEDRYRDLVEHSEDLVCTHDLEGRLLSVNPAPARILGYEVEELLKIPMRDLIVPEGRELFDAYLERLRTVGGPEKGLLRVITRSGEIRDWEYYNTLRTEGVERPIVRGMAHDVTERRRAELALSTSEQRYRMLFEKTVAGVAIISMEGKLIDCNDAWAHMFGYESATECQSSKVAERYFDPADREVLLEELRRDGAVIDRELHVRRKDGTPFWILLNDVLLPESPDRQLIQATVVDITARKEAEAAVRRSDERFRVALKDSPITVYSQDRDLRYTWVYNPHFFTVADVIGKTDDELEGAEQSRRERKLKQRVLETGVKERDEIVVSRNGKSMTFDVTVEPLLDAEDNIIGITGTSMDVDRMRQLIDSLRDDKERLAQEKSYLEHEIETELGFEEIVGQSPALREVLKKARVVAPSDASVLLLGESGTGKELVARAVHGLSSRHDKNFIKLNCAAVPSGLLESELFGHERGAFTGAVSQKVGRVELADKGTLFLDEIGELPLELQPKLLRLLQDREFERLGGVKTLRVDVRIISATNRDLPKEVAEREFREDLFYRLNVFPIQLPPLHERRSDIPLLVHHFVRKHAARMGKPIEIIPIETVGILQNWNWPGNIRELENMIERMVILSKGGVLAAPPEDLSQPVEVAEDDLAEMEREHIIRVLRETNGVLSGADGAASRLRVKRTTLQSMLKRFGIELDDFRRGTGTFGE
jgi:formate hydrogenlyase transcriptional activator